MIIKLVRHGESEANTGRINPFKEKDASIPLSKSGHAQALMTGEHIGKDFLNNALIYTSPYTRTRETLKNILTGAKVNANNIKIYEDPRLREVDMGYGNPESQHELRKIHGLLSF